MKETKQVLIETNEKMKIVGKMICSKENKFKKTKTSAMMEEIDEALKP